MVVAAFVAPYLLEATARFAVSAARLPGVALGIVTHQKADELPPALREHAVGHWRVDDALDPRQIEVAVRGLGQQLGGMDRVIGALEQLQVPLAQAREALGIDGMDVATALNVRDKDRMKTVFSQAGIPCARHRVVHGPAEAVAFAEEVGFPLVAKPPAGAGAQATYRLDDADTLQGYVQAVPPSSESPALLEEFLVGEEHSFESVTMHGRTVWSSVSDYLPPPLEVLRNPWIQWTVMLPRDDTVPAYDEIHKLGPLALQALGVQDALTHMEWFTRARRLRCDLGGGGTATRRTADLDARLRARHRLLQRVGRARGARPVRPAGATVCGRHRLPARYGARPSAGRAGRRPGAT